MIVDINIYRWEGILPLRTYKIDEIRNKYHLTGKSHLIIDSYNSQILIIQSFPL